MPHGESWFSLLPGYAHWLSDAQASHGPTWIAHGDVSIQHILHWIFLLVVLAVVGLLVRAKVADTAAAILPDGQFSLRTLIEGFAAKIYGTLVDMLGKKAAKFFLPLIGTCAFMIFFSNVFGLVPGFQPPTSNLNTTMAMALVIFFATHIFGVKENGLGYFKHFLGPFLPLAPLMLPIELISHIARPITLAVRLMANMTADHLVLGIFLTLAPWFVPVPLPLYFLGCIVVVVQTMVFCLLSTVYISMAIAHDH